MTPVSVHCAAKYIVDADSDYDLKVIANLYAADPPCDVTGSDQDGMTLVLCHATGFSKEIWELFLRHFFKRVNADKKLKIEAVYSIESPNHGESAILNEDILNTKYRNNCECTGLP